MRHRVYGKHLGRNKDQRQALFSSLVYSLFSHGTIQTSEAKAKAIKGLVDKLINASKINPKNPLSLVQSPSLNKNLQERLVKVIIPKLGDRTSGYTSTVRMGTQPGDQTMVIKMSLIGSEELKPIEEESKTEKVSEKKKETVQKIAAPKKEVKKTIPNKTKRVAAKK